MPYASLDRSPKHNWVEDRGGLPQYINRIANHLHDKGKTIGTAIAIAVNVVKKMCATGDVNFPGIQHVNAGSQAEACAAVAQWEAMKVGKRIEKGIRGRKLTDAEMVAEIVKSISEHPYWVIEKKHFSAARRRVLAARGMALPDGSYPIENSRDLKNAVTLAQSGHGNVAEAKKLIRRRAKKLGVKLPDTVKKIEMEDTEFGEIISDAFPEEKNRFEFTLTGEIEKSDPEKQMVFGWLSVANLPDGTSVVDKQGDVIDDLDRMEEVAYDFVLHSRDGGEMHVRKGVSTMVESFVSTPEKRKAMGIPEGVIPDGWWGGFKVNDQTVWDKVKKGEYKMFSVHGSGTRKAMD